VIRYANVAIGDIALTSQELLDLFSEDGAPAPVLGDVADFRFDLVLSNLTKYVQRSNNPNGKSGGFGSLNIKSGFETKFELKLTFSCCLDDECETFLCPEMPDSYCNHSLQPRETYYSCSKMDGAVAANGIQMEMGIFDMDKDPNKDAREIVTVWGYESFLYVQPDETESMVRVTDVNKDFDVSETIDSDGKKVGTFTAQKSGTGRDNPSDPGDVNLFQATKAVNFLFSHNASGKMIFNFKVSPLNSGLSSGRNLVFAGTGKQATCQPPAALAAQVQLCCRPVCE
jgi:hypothetical protein